MTALWFLVWAVSRAFNSVCMKKAQGMSDNNYKSSIYLTFIYALSQALFLLIIPPYQPIPTSFHVIFYPVLFGIFYMISYIMLFLALGAGPTALTNVIYTFHSILPMITGIIIWNDVLDIQKILGILIAAISVYLFYLSTKGGDKSKEGGKSKISLRWIAYILGATVVLGIAVVFTQTFAKSYPDLNKEYLIIYTLTSTLVSPLALLFVKKRNTAFVPQAVADTNGPTGSSKEASYIRKPKYYIYMFVAGASQNIINLLFMKFLNIMPSTVLFPTTNSINIITFVIVGRLFFKERLNRISFIGICTSLVSLVLLNI